jgi:hypothetical protein
MIVRIEELASCEYDPPSTYEDIPFIEMAESTLPMIQLQLF